MSDPVLYVVDGRPVSRDDWETNVRHELGLTATENGHVRALKPGSYRTIHGHKIERTLARWVRCQDCGSDWCRCHGMGGSWHCDLCSDEWDELRRSCANPACEGHEDEEEEVDRAAE